MHWTLFSVILKSENHDMLATKTVDDIIKQALMYKHGSSNVQSQRILCHIVFSNGNDKPYSGTSMKLTPLTQF